MPYFDGEKVELSSKDHPGAEFDEIVVGRWLHIEQMDTGFWWGNVGGVTIHVKADRDGRPKRVTVHMPDCYAEPFPGCVYELNEEQYPIERTETTA